MPPTRGGKLLRELAHGGSYRFRQKWSTQLFRDVKCTYVCECQVVCIVEKEHKCVCVNLFGFGMEVVYSRIAILFNHKLPVQKSYKDTSKQIMDDY